MKEKIFEHLLSTYNRFSATHNYIFGFEYDGIIYYTERTSESLALLLKLDEASRGKGFCLRFKPTKDMKIALAPTCKILCSAAYFKAEKEATKYNNGETFERLLTEKAGQTWSKDSIAFTEQGDLKTDGKDFQIKFQGASFITEKQAARLTA